MLTGNYLISNCQVWVFVTWLILIWLLTEKDIRVTSRSLLQPLSINKVRGRRSTFDRGTRTPDVYNYLWKKWILFFFYNCLLILLLIWRNKSIRTVSKTRNFSNSHAIKKVKQKNIKLFSNLKVPLIYLNDQGTTYHWAFFALL